MIDEKDEIFMIENEIEKLENELLDINPKSPENRFKYTNKKSELNILKRKLRRIKGEQEFVLKSTFKSINQLEKTHTNRLVKIKIKPFKNIH